MRICKKCKIAMDERTDTMPDGIPFKHYYCPQCHDEFLDMKQLHDLAEKYREYKRLKAKITKWGSSLGVRIPKELAKKYGLKSNSEVVFVPEKDSIKMIVA